MASNLYSLAQAKAQPECIPLAVCNDGEVVGFLMYGMDFEEKEYWIYRLMIDQKYQRMGRGIKIDKREFVGALNYRSFSNL